jgi:RHS repeat-associated protein
VAGTFSAAYDADGALVTQALPGGYTLTVSQDETGAQTSRVYSKDSDGTIVASDSVDQGILGQIVSDDDTAGQTRTRSYTYDAAGRLTRADTTDPDSACTRHDYTFDNNSNRTALATMTSDVSAACTSTGATTTSYSYDSADRLVTSGTVYDAFGRTTTQASGTAIGYYANDLVRQQTSGASRQTWGLDAAGRLATWTTETQGSDSTWTQTGSKTNHYGSDGDTPSWTQETSSTLTRNVQGIDGDLSAVTSATGDTVLQLTNVHGDATVLLPLDTTKAPTALAYDEYGNLQTDTTTRYGWLGSQQRSGDTPSGATMMGLRLYDPTTGRFLSIDPIVGGNSNAYDYCGAEPVNCTDITGAFRVSWWDHWWSPVHYVSIKFSKRETSALAVGSGSVGALLGIVKDKLPKSFQNVIWALRLVAWYITTVSAYAKARGKCTKIAAGAVKGAYWLSSWNAWAAKC